MTSFLDIIFFLMCYQIVILSIHDATQTKTLHAIFKKPVNGNLEWSKIESLFIAVGCRAIETKIGVAFEKDGAREYFHRPHPDKAALRYRVTAARSFLIRIGVGPEETKN